MARRRKKLGEILTSWNIVSPTALGDALQYAKQNGKRIGEALVELELASEEDVIKALATQFDLEYVDLDKNVVVPSALEFVPENIIKTRFVLPMAKEDNRLKVVISDPLDLELLDMLRFRLNMEVDCALAPRSKIQRFIDTFMGGVGSSIDEAIETIDRDRDLAIKE
ncbi:MAG: GspE/PulE/PilB domain-containing protein, partial [Planctomycetota bacterium]